MRSRPAGRQTARAEESLQHRFVSRLSRRRLTGSLVALAAVGLGSAGAAGAYSSHSAGYGYGGHSKTPVTVTVFSPGARDVSGSAGAGFIVDVALDANKL